jgi:anti-sigma B factor antagonist
MDLGLPEPLRIACWRDEQAYIVAVAGELDMAAAPLLQAALEQVLGHGPTEPPLAARPEVLVADLVELRLLSAAGLTVLYAAHHLAAEVGVRLRVVIGASGRSPAARILRSTGLSSVFDVYPSVREAKVRLPPIGNA